MVKGIDVFRDYFMDYPDQYVLIGGAACDISFASNRYREKASVFFSRKEMRYVC